MSQDKHDARPKVPVVSSEHLSKILPGLSELEFSLTLAANAFHRWMARCAMAAGAQLTPIEVLIIHTVRHRDRPKRMADIALVLDIEDTHLVSYAIGKLEKLGLISTKRIGKEKFVEVTAAGLSFCDTYREIREQILVSALDGDLAEDAALSEIAQRLRVMSGRYSQAARSAATL